jgi:MOSC domain-containing protein YiiM|tara:strand:+ start:16180 stop:16674 length:495 start_codon:yes stop_codon:yes gene_type:complete
MASTLAATPITLCGIAIRERSAAPMQSLSAATVTCRAGVEGDARGRPGKRQVTVLSLESWNRACTELGVTLCWTQRRANLLVSGVEFGPDSVGQQLQLGSLTLEVTRETDPCRRMDAAYPGLQAALAPDWRGGVCCRVLSDGELTVGLSGLLVPAPLQGALPLT